MPSLIDLILQYGGDAAAEAELRNAIDAQLAAVLASAGCGNTELVGQAERAVEADAQAAFQFDTTGSATLAVGNRTWHAGRFSVLSLRELRERIATRRSGLPEANVRLWVLDGRCASKDIGSLQANASQNTLFQVASQFNCLESPGPYVTPVSRYFFDNTQGPRASISAFPATLLRHYLAPGPNGERFVQQSDGPQIDLLAAACGRPVVRNGYFTGEGIDDVQSAIQSLEQQFDDICVGVHEDAQVVLGYEWNGSVENSAERRIAQVFTSTAAGGYGAERYLGREGFELACQHLLRAAYLGTFLAAAMFGKDRVVVTLIGGGAFGNPGQRIWEAIEWSIDAIRPLLSRNLDVIVNGFTLRQSLRRSDALVLPAVRRYGGALLTFNESGLDNVAR